MTPGALRSHQRDDVEAVPLYPGRLGASQARPLRRRGRPPAASVRIPSLRLRLRLLSSTLSSGQQSGIQLLQTNELTLMMAARLLCL